MGTKVTFIITVSSEEEVSVNYYSVHHAVQLFLPDLLDAAEVGMLDWTLDIETDEIPSE